MVEDAGQNRLEATARSSYGGDAKVLTNVTRRARDRTGALMLAPLCEIDALVADGNGAIQQVISAKQNPNAVHRARDRSMLSDLYDSPTGVADDAAKGVVSSLQGKLIAKVLVLL